MEINFADSKKKLSVEDTVFGCEFKEGLIHQVVTAYLAGARAGTKAQKTRSDVRGGGAKPFRQKGTGRARAGTIRSPIWRTGGVTFAARPRDYTQKVNKKMYRGAIRSILSELVRQERLLVVADIKVTEAKTKALVAQLKAFNTKGKVLLVTENVEESLYLASRNLPDVALLDVVTTLSDPVTLVTADQVVMTEAAVKALEGLLK